MKKLWKYFIYSPSYASSNAPIQTRAQLEDKSSTTAALQKRDNSSASNQQGWLSWLQSRIHTRQSQSRLGKMLTIKVQDGKDIHQAFRDEYHLIFEYRTVQRDVSLDCYPLSVTNVQDNSSFSVETFSLAISKHHVNNVQRAINQVMGLDPSNILAFLSPPAPTQTLTLTPDVSHVMINRGLPPVDGVKTEKNSEQEPSNQNSTVLDDKHSSARNRFVGNAANATGAPSVSLATDASASDITNTNQQTHDSTFVVSPQRFII